MGPNVRKVSNAITQFSRSIRLPVPPAVRLKRVRLILNELFDQLNAQQRTYLHNVLFYRTPTAPSGCHSISTLTECFGTRGCLCISAHQHPLITRAYKPKSNNLFVVTTENTLTSALDMANGQHIGCGQRAGVRSKRSCWSTRTR